MMIAGKLGITLVAMQSNISTTILVMMAMQIKQSIPRNQLRKEMQGLSILRICQSPNLSSSHSRTEKLMNPIAFADIWNTFQHPSVSSFDRFIASSHTKLCEKCDDFDAASIEK